MPVAKSILDQQKYFDQKVESLAQEDDHELSKLPVVQDSDLKRYRQCVHPSSKQRELWFTYGISSMLWYANTHKTIIDLVEQNVGWANVPEMMVMEGINKGQLIALPVAHEHGGWITPVGCLVSRRHINGPVLTSLIEKLEGHSLQYNQWQAN